MEFYVMDLQLFAEGETAAAPAGGGAETGTAAGTETASPEIRVGDTLGDGTQVTDARVAAALNRHMNRHPEMRKVYGQGQQQPVQPAQGQEQAAQETGTGPDDIQARWEAAKKGEFKDLYGQDVQKAIQARFKNQEDANAKLTARQPMIDALMKKTGAESEEELQKLILDDDSLYEEEAEAAGMTVEAYKQFKHLQAEHDAVIAREQRAQDREKNMRHIAGLHQQAEELKQMFPNFDLNKEMQNPEFFELTKPGGISVKQAYFAVHGDELVPQLMGYGMQRAQQQMGQTLQAQRARPAEGAMNAKNQAAAEPKLNPLNLSKQERAKYKEYIKLHGPITFDGGGKT